MYELASQSGLHYVRLRYPFGEDNGGSRPAAEGGGGGEDDNVKCGRDPMR